MKKTFLLMMLLMGLVLSTGNAVAAQELETETTADVDAVAEAVLAVDPTDLATALEEAPTDADLPEGFKAPVDGTPENAEVVDAFSTGLGDLEGAVGNVTHGLDTDPDVVPGMLSSGILTYITADEEISDSDLDDFQEGVEEGLGTSSPDATAERVEIQGTEAVLVTLPLEESGTSVIVQMLAIPVGNTMVIATVLVVDTTAVDVEEVQPFTAELAVAGVNYLGTVAEGA
jgi:hypothetical protein